MLINDDEMVTNDKTLAQTVNEHHINTIRLPSGLKPEKMEFENSLNTNRNILHSITDRYKNHSSILCKWEHLKETLFKEKILFGIAKTETRIKRG